MKISVIGLVCLICMILVTGSCKQIILWRYGIHEPRKETPESIQQFLARHGFPNENIFIPKDSSAWGQYLRDSIYHRNFLGTLIFSPQGLLDNLKDTSQCQWSGGYYVSILKKDTSYHIDTTHSFTGLMANLVPLSEDTEVDTSGADFYAVVTWGTFLGKYNQRLFVIHESIKEHRELLIKPVFINIDMQEGWNLAKYTLEIRDD